MSLIVGSILGLRYIKLASFGNHDNDGDNNNTKNHNCDENDNNSDESNNTNGGEGDWGGSGDIGNSHNYSVKKNKNHMTQIYLIIHS